MSKDKFIAGKHDECHHEGRRSTQRRLDASQAALDGWNGGTPPHEQVLKYFTIFHEEHPIYEEMPLKPVRHNVDLLVDQGQLGLQGRIDGTHEVFLIPTSREVVGDTDVTRRIEDISQELKMIAYSAKFDGNGDSL
jgi:hypothetical protein